MDVHRVKSYKRSSQEEERFKSLFREYFASMCVFANRYLKDSDAARDVVHDVFCRIWEDPLELAEVSNVKNYLYTTVRNACLDLLRRRDIHCRYMSSCSKEEPFSDEFFEMETLREDIYRMLDEAIQLLPGRSREILLLKLQGRKNREIAERLGVSVNTVNTLKAHAYKVLREKLQDKYLYCLFILMKRCCLV